MGYSFSSFRYRLLSIMSKCIWLSKPKREFKYANACTTPLAGCMSDEITYTRCQSLKGNDTLGMYDMASCRYPPYFNTLPLASASWKTTPILHTVLSYE